MHFWNKMEEEYGTINPHIRNILKKQNLCSQSLSQLTVESIRQIEQDMRIMADYLREDAVSISFKSYTYCEHLSVDFLPFA